MTVEPVPAVGSGANRIVVDWDGTCVIGAWPKMGDWLPGAREALRAMLEAGYEVVILSTRLAPMRIDERTERAPGMQEREVWKVRTMLDDAGLEDVGIWENPWKPGAAVYIDDKALHFDGLWAPVLREVWDRLGIAHLRLVKGGKA